MEETTTAITTAVEIATEVTTTDCQYLAQIAQDLRLLLIIVFICVTCKVLSVIFGYVLGLNDC